MGRSWAGNVGAGGREHMRTLPCALFTAARGVGMTCVVGVVLTDLCRVVLSGTTAQTCPVRGISDVTCDR